MSSTEQLRTLFRKSESIIRENCYENFHAHVEKIISNDDGPVVRLFRETENIIKDSTTTIQTVITSTKLNEDPPPPNVDENSFSFTSSLTCILKCISCKMTCGNDPGDIIALENSTKKILAELKEYSWEAKAVLGLAAFALEYGEFSLLTYLYGTQKIQGATSIPIFKRVSGLLKQPGLLKSKHSEIKELNVLILHTLDVIRCIHELQQLSENTDLRDVPSLTKAIKGIPVTVYLSIVTLVACATKVTQLLTSDDKQKPHDLISGFVNEIKFISETISGQFKICTRERDEAIAYSIFQKRIHLRTHDSMEVIKILKLWDNVLPKSDEKEVEISELKGKHVVLLFTRLEVSVEEILILKPISKNKDCKLVWVPIVKEWTEERKKQRKAMSNQMSSVYTVQYSSTKESLKFIKEEWSCYDVEKGNTALVLMNPQGEVVKTSTTVRQLIHLYKLNELPVKCPVKNQYISVTKKWMTSTVQKSNPTLIPDEWTKDKNKYILYYGGRDNAWIQEFKRKATTFQKHDHIKNLKLSIELVPLEETPTVETFWSEIDDFFYASAHKEVDTITKEVQKLFSYKYEVGWAVLCKGSSVVTAGHGSSIYKVLENFETKWKNSATDQEKFESCFVQQHKEVLTAYCCNFEFRSEDGFAPETMQCPICPGTIRKSVIYRYRCCHPQN